MSPCPFPTTITITPRALPGTPRALPEPEVHRCKNPTTETTMKFLHEQFARFGLVSDNGSQLASIEFKELCESYLIDHVTTAPFHPRSNGQAERFVDTLKRALKKVRATPTEKALQQFLIIKH